MGFVDYETFRGELSLARDLCVCTVLVRGSLYHGADNRCATLFLTDKSIFLEEAGDAGRLRRIGLNSARAEKTGFAVWECIRISYLELEGESVIYVCPFTGDRRMPKKDHIMMERIVDLIEDAG
jgi:hypothetical protein